MSRTPHGLIIGKFHPPHRGHELLFRSAARNSVRLTVLVLGKPSEAIPVESRVAWIREMLVDVGNCSVAGGTDVHPINYDSPAIWDLHEQEFRRVLAAVTNEPVTAVFSSEDYGAELARRFGATNVALDEPRTLVPVSSTFVRENPVDRWEDLPLAVRAGLCKRVVLLGAESTGTTTTSRDLVDVLRSRGGAHGLTRWVPECGRDVTISKLADASAFAQLQGQTPPTMGDLQWPTGEFVTIARSQNRIEDEEARIGGPVLVCDTDAFATGIWHERYRRCSSSAVEALARKHSLYLLTQHGGVPFEQDGIRDGESHREWMTERFEQALTETNRRYVSLNGTRTQRLTTALSAIDKLLFEGWEFGVSDQ